MTRLIKLENKYNPIEYSIEQFIEDHPDVDPCDAEFQELSPEILLKYNIHILHEVVKPSINGNFVEGPPVFLAEKWIQNWIKQVPPPWE